MKWRVHHPPLKRFSLLLFQIHVCKHICVRLMLFFSFRSELIVLHGEKEHQQQGLNRNRIERNTCSWSTFDQAIGIKVCASYQVNYTEF